jgi:hypothetical protein
MIDALRVNAVREASKSKRLKIFLATTLLGVQIDYDVVHLRTSSVQLFVLLQLNFEEVVQIIELRRFGGAPNGYPFAALDITLVKGKCVLDLLS